MASNYDLIIVGAGPAGAIAAKAAGDQGIKTALLERKQDTSVIHRCCTEILNINEEFFGETLLFDEQTKQLNFTQNNFSFSYDGPYKPVYGINIMTPGGEIVRIDGGDENREKRAFYGLAVEKGILVQGLIDEAGSKGVEVFTNTNVVDVRKTAQGLLVSDANGNLYLAQFVIAADGLNSRIARNRGINKERNFTGTYKCKAWTMVDVDIPVQDALMFSMGTKTSISISPRGKAGEFHLASSSYFHDQDLDGPLQEFIKSEAYAPWFKNARDIGHNTACVSNIMAALPVPFKDNILFAGDAGWIQETSIAGALLCGWQAALAVVQGLKDNKISREGVQGYLDWWEKYLYGPHGPRVESTGDLGDFLDPEDFDYMASLVKAPQPGTMNFYRLVRTIGKAYMDVLPQLQEERPDIMEKFMAIRGRTEYEALFARRKKGFLND